MGVLDGVKVLEAGLLVQGPQASLTMLEWGADVIKVELPGFGDQSRWLPISRQDRRSAFFTAYNRGKRSVTVDLRLPAGREVFPPADRRRRRGDHQLQARDDGELGSGLRRGRRPQCADHLRHGVVVRSRRPRCRPRRRRPERASGRWPHQHHRWPGRRPQFDRRHRGRPHLGPEPSRRDTGRALRQGAHRARPADRDLVARRTDLGPGRRVHPLPHVRLDFGAERPRPPDDSRASTASSRLRTAGSPLSASPEPARDRLLPDHRPA